MKIWWIFKTYQHVESLFHRKKNLGINISPKWKVYQKLFIKVSLKLVHILQVLHTGQGDRQVDASQKVIYSI